MSSRIIFTLFALSIFLFAVSCKKTDDLQPTNNNINSSEVAENTLNDQARVSTLTHPGRTLSANCFQCHGTDGYAGELKIAGMGYSELSSKLNSFRIKDPKSDIMNFHAQSFTSGEINLIADYFSKQ